MHINNSRCSSESRDETGCAMFYLIVLFRRNKIDLKESRIVLKQQIQEQSHIEDDIMCGLLLPLGKMFNLKKTISNSGKKLKNCQRY